MNKVCEKNFCGREGIEPSLLNEGVALNEIQEGYKAKRGLRRYYVCEKCSKRRKTTRVLHAHHRKSWDRFPDDRYDRSNGVVMCIPCHNKFHKKYKFEALDKPELLDEYLKN